MVLCSVVPKCFYLTAAMTLPVTVSARGLHNKVACRDDGRGVDENKKIIPWRYPLPKACTDGTLVEPKRELDCRPVPHVQKRPATVEDIAVFHYITKSEEDFERKSVRGGGGGSHRTWDHFNRVQKYVRLLPCTPWLHRS